MDDRVILGPKENGFFKVVPWICGYSSHEPDFNLHTPRCNSSPYEHKSIIEALCWGWSLNPEHFIYQVIRQLDKKKSKTI